MEHLLREYTELNQSVIQLTKIISDGLTHLKKLPVLPKASILRTTQNAEDAAQHYVETFTTRGTAEGSLRTPAYRPRVLCIGRWRRP